MYPRSPRIMILSASYGDGHVQVSRSLKQRFLSQGIEDVQIVDLMKEAHPLLNTITTKLYLKSSQTSKFGLDYYGWSYYMTRNTKPDGSWGKYFNYLGKKKLKEMIDQQRPDVLINSFPFGAVPEIGRDLAIPAFTVVTDYALHSRWIHPDTRKYYVATKELKAELVTNGLTSSQIEVSGIPIRQAFYRASKSRSSFHSLLNPVQKTVLIAAGSYGVLDQIEGIAKSLIEKGNCQLAVVCGRNQKLQQKLGSLFQSNKNVHVFGFVENIHELMAMSSCIVTKAGGITLTEALALQLPIFIFKPFAGQEKENALFFSRKGIAQISSSTQELQEQLIHFLNDRSYQRSIRRQMSSLHQEEAADFIVRDILLSLDRKVLAPVSGALS